ncbi:LuxR C-terminal-related transcriptional regulator [Yersinia pestis]|uniref:ORF2 n=3 Tax=Yersinia pestis TaxID=632 RepID=Q9RPN1_YERPE|nr:LuxR C-terminal-related transcriptional regulator [Yersinia pestis]AAF05098.1 ORF2 [Yersinia pestis]MDL0804048.1 LuxR C-terminal-related transcriptional regulator [Yersinia pestis]MDL0867212.1 LuxR C-terminal-related transcriptional regulator [Yersinia pestis]MDL1199876.1 LuxR C-terminal-related transcriptional regulator [Yersinia pestis]MDL1203767.1 LuxR C-terminal-related transcriptional regulator [Yersinia pestis]
MTESDATRIASLHQIFDEDELTDHQKDIVLMYAFGFTFREIADEKCIRENTISYHLEKVRCQLGNLTLNSLRSVILLRVFMGRSS